MTDEPRRMHGMDIGAALDASAALASTGLPRVQVVAVELEQDMIDVGGPGDPDAKIPGQKHLYVRVAALGTGQAYVDTLSALVGLTVELRPVSTTT